MNLPAHAYGRSRERDLILAFAAVPVYLLVVPAVVVEPSENPIILLGRQHMLDHLNMTGGGFALRWCCLGNS